MVLTFQQAAASLQQFATRFQATLPQRRGEHRGDAEFSDSSLRCLSVLGASAVKAGRKHLKNAINANQGLKQSK